MEGIVKYSLSYTKGLLPAALIYDTPRIQTLDRLRTNLVDGGFIGVDATGLGFGNVSCRIRKQGSLPESFIISGTSTGQHRMLGLQGYALITKACSQENYIEAQGLVAPSSEALSHAAIYASCPHVNFVVHGHHADLFAWGITAKSPSTAENIEYGTPAMARAIKHIVENQAKGFFIMRGHVDGFFMYGTEIMDIKSYFNDFSKYANTA